MSFRALVLASLLAVAAMPAAGPALAQSTPAQPREILVRFRNLAGRSVRALAAQRLAGPIVKSNAALDYVKIRVPEGASLPGALARLRADRNVVWAEANGSYSALACTSCPQDPYLLPLAEALPGGENQWGIFTAGVPWLWRQGGGGSSSVLVAILDTGIDNFGAPHPDLAANVSVTGFDFVDDDADPTDSGPANLYGHGTHVAGVVAGVANTEGISGVAYASKVMVIRVLDCNAGVGCPGSFEDVADGIQFAADHGARVINMSLGGADSSATVRTAIHYAIARGTIVVAASGNDGAAVVGYPARYPEVISVGATDASDHVASFSNYGDDLDVVAPGVNIWSAFPGPAYRSFQGTSQASPLVAGIAALIASRSPAITQEEMQRTLREHAQPLAGVDAARDGFGRVAFPPLTDWSDAPPPYVATGHANYLWEWLGRDASAEQSFADLTDGDFRPNVGASHHGDGYDDGVFPASFPRLPFLPPHVGAGAAVDIGLQVARFDGPRYSTDPAKQLHIDSWFDWDSDRSFESGTAAERGVADYTENPGTWGGNAKLVTRPLVPVDEHILGNPLVVRTRVAYGASPGDAVTPVQEGEVEDDVMINFVEDFDITKRVHTSGVYTVMDTWSVTADPTPPCSHRGVFHLASTNHPAVGAPCNGFIERINVMGTPVMNWKEYTRANLSFWYCHQATGCSPAGDFCRVRIDTSGVKHDLGPIPIGSGTFSLDLSAYLGSEAVIIEFVEQTDFNGRIAIDDVVVVAFDAHRPAAISNLALARVPGTNELGLTWTAPAENEGVAPAAAQRLANVYDMRYSIAPITTEAAWDDAQRFLPGERVGGSAIPDEPGAAQAVTFKAPSAFEPYYVAVRTGDEVVALSALSNSPWVNNLPTLAVDVAGLTDTLTAPGDTTLIRFRVSNTGNAPDTYALTAADDLGWTMVGMPGAIAIAPGASADVALPVVIPSGAGGDTNTVVLKALSLANGIAQDSDGDGIRVSGTVDAPHPVVAAALPAGLHAVGPNPFRAGVTFGLKLERSGQAAVEIFDLGGRLVRRLAEGTLAAGDHRFAWDGRDDRGHAGSSGCYFLRARAPGLDQSIRLLRLE